MRSRQLLCLTIAAPLFGAAALVACRTNDSTTGEDEIGAARLAVTEPTVITDILGDPSGATATIVGRAEVGTTVSIYQSASCSGPVVATGTVGQDGKLAVPLTPPAQNEVLTAKTNGGSPGCSNAVPYNVVHHECPAVPANRQVTRTPIAIQQTNGYFTEWAEGKPEYTNYYNDMVADPPALQYHYDFPGALPIDTGFKGAVSGVGSNGLWGEGGADDYLKSPLLSPDDLVTRIDYLEDYLATYQGITRTAQYGDFGTQLFGDHTLRTGFWEFYDQWSSYDAKIGLGGATPPSDPTDWLKRHYDPTYLYPPPSGWAPLPSSMMGLSFDYWPQKGSSGQYRYAVDILSDGFERYWGQVVEHSALAGYEVTFFDNAGFRFCWNQDCEDGYDTWLAQRYTQAEIDRYMTYVTSYDETGTFDLKWDHHSNGTWTNPWVQPDAGATVKPSTDAVHGPYSGHFVGPGLVYLPYYDIPHDLQEEQWKYHFMYKTNCPNAKMFAIVDHGSGGAAEPEYSLGSPTVWSYNVLPLIPPVPPEKSSARIAFNLGNTACDLWVDDITFHPRSEGPVAETRLARKQQGELDDTRDITLGAEATMKFWDQSVDERLLQLRDIGRQVNPAYDIFINNGRQRRGAGYFMVEEQLLDSETATNETGSAPGVYMPRCDVACNPWSCSAEDTPPEDPQCRCQNFHPVNAPTLITNVFDYKLANEWRYPDEFSYLAFMPQRKADYFLYTQEAALLHLAEGAAFGGGAALDLQLEIQNYWYPYGSGIRGDLIRTRHDFLQWTNANPDLYRCLVSAAPVGVVIHDVPNTHTLDLVQLGNSLFTAGVPYDIVSESHVDLESLQQYRAIVYHHVGKVPAAEAAAISAYLQGGGVVLLSGDGLAYDDYYRLWPAHPQPAWPPVTLVSGTTTYPVGAGRLVHFPSGVTAAQIQSELGGLDVTPSLSGAAKERFRVATWIGPTRTVVHLVNYDTKVGFDSCHSGSASAPHLQSVVIQIPAPAPHTKTTARILSPEGGVSIGDNFPITSGPNDTLSITVPDMHLYSVLVLE